MSAVGVSSGASAPEWLVDELVAALRGRGATEVREVEVVPEDVAALPGTLRRDAEAARAEVRGTAGVVPVGRTAPGGQMARQDGGVYVVRRRAGRTPLLRRLHEKGVAATVLEASDGVGGRVRTDRVDDFLLDRGFQVLLTACPGPGTPSTTAS